MSRTCLPGARKRSLGLWGPEVVFAAIVCTSTGHVPHGLAATTRHTFRSLRLLSSCLGIVAKGPVLFGFGDLRSKMQSNTHAARSTGNDGRGLSTASVDTFLLQVLPSLVFSCPVAVFVLAASFSHLSPSGCGRPFLFLVSYIGRAIRYCIILASKLASISSCRPARHFYHK